MQYMKNLRTVLSNTENLAFSTK